MLKAIFWITLMLHAMPPQAVNVVEHESDSISIIGYGAVSGAEDGVLESVARNRMRNLAEPALPPDTNLAAYDALVATERCVHVGASGWLVVRDGDGNIGRIHVLVVDCQAKQDRLGGGALTDLGLLADVSASAQRYWHWRGYLILEAQDGIGRQTE